MIIKHFTNSFEFISSLNIDQCKLIVKGYENHSVQASLNIKNSSIIIKTIDLFPQKLNTEKTYDLQLVSGSNIFYLPNSLISAIKDEYINHQKGYIITFNSEELNNYKNYGTISLYYRAIIPLSKKVNLHHIFETSNFQEGTLHSSDCIELKIKNANWHLIKYKNDNEEFFIIDCLNKDIFENFSNLLFSILVAFGFITSKFYQNEIFYFSYENIEQIDFKYFVFRKTRKSSFNIFQLITSNPYNLRIDRSDQIKYNRKLNSFSQTDFSKLCELIISSDQILATVLLLIESPTYPLETMTLCYSVALETISTYFSEQNEKKMKPIKSKKLFNSIKKKFNEIIHEEKEKNPKENFSILLKKIDNLNTPTNKDKLQNVFIFNNISLSDEDNEILLLRNKILHGMFSTLYKDCLEREKSQKLFLLCVRTHFLISRVILKLINYEGFVINLPKLYYESNYGLIISGEYFIKNIIVESEHST